jgi:predicted CopG family antitoxin
VREVVSKRKENVKLYENGKLKKRDVEILKFVLEMKFVSIEEVYEKFFKVKMNGEKSKSDWWARDRVYQLKKMGF